MSNLDIVARLSLDAKQFSSEAGARFAEMASSAQAASVNIKKEFGGAFAEVQKLAQQSIAAPRTSGGGLNLAGEIAQLTESAKASDIKAEALRQLSVAQHAASTAAGIDTQAMLLEADAAAVAALAEGRNTEAIRERIRALQAVQTELDQSILATNKHNDAGARYVVSAGQQRASTMMLGQQVQDFAVQVSNGGNVMTAFSQQIGQAAFAVQGMGGRLGSVAAFLGSGWGTALLVGLTVLAPLVGKMLEHNNALDEAVAKLKKEAAQTELTARSHDVFAKSIEGQIDAQQRLNKELEKSVKTQIQVEQGNLNLSRSRLSAFEREKIKADAALVTARQNLRNVESSAPVTMGTAATVAYAQRLSEARADVAKLKAEAERYAELVSSTRKGVRDAELPLIERQVANSLDASKAATDRYTVALGNLREERKKGIISARQFYEQDRKNQVDRDKAIKAAQETAREEGRKPRVVSLGNQLQAEQAASVLASAQSYRGLNERTDKGALQSLFAASGASLDPEKVAWCAAFVNAVLAGKGITGTGSLSARSFLNYGEATKSPNKGDIVVSRRGSGGQGHVGFYEGLDASGNVRVLGGNTADGVGTQTVARNDVLGFRRAATGAAMAKSEAAAARDAEQAQRQLEAALESLTSRYDPLTAAADRYKAALAEIDKFANLPAKSAQKIAADKAALMRGAAQAEYLKTVQPELFAKEDDGGWLEKTKARDKKRQDAAERSAKRAQDDMDRRAEDQVRFLGDTFYSLFSGRTDDIWRSFQERGADTLSQLAVEWVRQIASKEAIGGAMTGGSVFSQLGSRFGAKGGQIGGAAGTAIGAAFPQLMSSIAASMPQFAAAMAASDAISSLLGLKKTAGGMFGVLGNLFGTVFSKPKVGSAGVGFDQYGNFAGTAATGNSTGAATSLASNFAAQLQNIADQLGASLGGTTDVRIGTKNGKIHVNPIGGQIGKKGSGDTGFGDDEAAAIAFAVREALKDGILTGISQASQSILRSGQDINKAIEKALRIESIPKTLKAMLDPVGAALDALNTDWAKTKAALIEGGASIEQMAQAQQLYNLQIDQTKASTVSASQALKDFQASFNLGSASPYSLRDQEATAIAALQPFLNQIKAGGTIDQGKYQEAASAYLDIERQLYGSTDKYFDALDAVQAATAAAISKIDNAVPITPGVPDPFTKVTAAAVQTANEIADGQTALLAEIARLMGQLTASTGRSGGSSFVGTSRDFVNAA